MATGVLSTHIAPGLSIDSRRLVSSTDSADAEVNMGDEVTLNDGRKYKYFNAREAIAISQIITMNQPDDGDISAAASDNTLTTAGGGDFTADEFDAGTVDRREYYAATNANTGTGQTRRIVSNTATVLTLDTAWTTATDATTDYVTFGPYNINLTSAAAEMVVGVAISAISANNNGWFQIAGFCPQVRCVGTTDPTILRREIVSSGTAGACKGPTAAGVTAAEAANAFGWALFPYPSADAAARGVAAILKCAYS